MATWVEDIIQALENLGGQGSFSEIAAEIQRLRKEPLNATYENTIRARIFQNSSDSKSFKEKDLFRKVSNGVWALRAQENQEALSPKHPSFPNNEETREGKTTWVQDIVRAITILGGQATLTQIFDEVKRIRQSPLPKTWQHIILDTIYQHSSDTQKFQGNDIFKKVNRGVWGLRQGEGGYQPLTRRTNEDAPVFQNYLPAESFEEIANILTTIRQYRDYQQPDSSSWKEYVEEFFHILGFSTIDKNQRITALSLLGENHSPKAIVCFVEPGENFDEICPGLQWESYLFYAANFYQVEWGVLTNGLQLKIIHFKDRDKLEQTYWPDLDEIVCKEKLDTFFSIHKVFSFIKEYNGLPTLQAYQKKSQQIKNKADLKDRHILYQKFWGELLEKAKTKTKLHAQISPRTENWISAGAGKSGLGFNYVVRMDDARVELYIDRGEAEWNKMVFNTFLQYKVEIENLFGGPLDWQLLPDKRASRIRFVISSYGLKDKDQWDELQEELIDAMIRLERALRVFIGLLSDLP